MMVFLFSRGYVETEIVVTTAKSDDLEDDDDDETKTDTVKSPLCTNLPETRNDLTRSLPDLLQTKGSISRFLSNALIYHGVSSEVINYTGSVEKSLQELKKSQASLDSNINAREKDRTIAHPTPKLFDLSLLKNIQFLTFCIGICLYTLSFQASYVFLPPLAIQNGQSDIEAAYVVSTAGALETLGSILSGIILDHPVVKPHRLLIYNIVLFVLGILTVIIPFLSVFGWLLFVCGMYGFLLGSCLAQKATLVVDILGVEHLVSSLGLLVCFQGFGVLFGPPLSGMYYYF